MKITATIAQAGACHQTVMVVVQLPSFLAREYPDIPLPTFEKIGQKLRGALERAGLRLQGENWHTNGVNTERSIELQMNASEVAAAAKLLATLSNGHAEDETVTLWRGFNTVLTAKLQSVS